jgi:hypothetical protein
MLRAPRTVLLPLVVALVTLTVGAAPSAQAKSHTIVPGKWAVKRLGPFKTQNSRHYRPTVGQAIRAFGRPSSRFQKQGGCVVKWKRLGLRIEFWNFGGTPPGETICSDDVGLAQSFNVTGRKFRTWRGLRVGMRESRLLRLHPGADWFGGDRYSPPAWWLRQQASPYGDGSDYAIVAARMHRDRVSQLDGWIGAAGE